MADDDMATPRALIADFEEHAGLPPGAGERFSGYGVLGLPFSSGHVLALRRFPASSLGPGYTSVWLRTPAGSWVMYATVAPSLSCPRFFGSALEAASVHEISLAWRDDACLTVGIGDDVDLEWDIRLGSTPATRLMTALAGALPDQLWRRRLVLRAIAAVAGPSLRAGRIGLTGRASNRQHFSARPQRLWLIRESRALLHGQDLGTIRALPAQARLGDFRLPQRGLFMAGSVVFESFDPARHLQAPAPGTAPRGRSRIQGTLHPAGRLVRSASTRPHPELLNKVIDS
ncbi:hypothetical protein ACFQ36_18980 [Arthrobacter sp. GCM10027362]|uniref:hypothetical protein n=1 Tax=Arthrobacter sp. GCM10027362 TaxID=3273379 RepID=UPI003645238A